MATDERNFRSHYYEKVGFRGVEEKKSLEILLKDKPLDVIKLKQFCLRFPVPALHRNKVWKVLLGKLQLTIHLPKLKIHFNLFVYTFRVKVYYLHTPTVMIGFGNKGKYNSVISHMPLILWDM